jgi:hypothetical protein
MREKGSEYIFSGEKGSEYICVKMYSDPFFHDPFFQAINAEEYVKACNLLPGQLNRN